MHTHDSRDYIKKLVTDGFTERQAEKHKNVIDNERSAKEDILKSEKKIAKSKADIIKWMDGMFVALFFGLGALMSAMFSYFFPAVAP